MPGSETANPFLSQRDGGDTSERNAPVTTETNPQPRDRRFDRLNWSLIGLAVALRTVRYLHDHALWLDEAYLALNLISRSFAELTSELDGEQYAPIGFLYVMKAVIVAFGTSNYAFRLFPYVVSLVAVWAFYALAKRVLAPAAVPVALALFAISYPFLIYAAETKPYGLDAAIAMLITLAGIHFGSRGRPTVLDAVVLALGGSIAVWLSYPSAFVLASVGIALATRDFGQRNWRGVGLVVVLAAAWLLSFILQMSIVRGGVPAQVPDSDLGHLREFYADHFFPWPPNPVVVSEWLLHFMSDLIGYFTSEVMSGIGIIALIMGCFALFVRDRFALAVLTLPWIVAILVSAAHYYPLADRFTLFTGPAALLLIAAGCNEIRLRFGADGKVVWILIIAALCFQPAMRAVKQSIWLDRFGDARPAVARLDENIQPSDKIYLYWTGEPLYRLYSTRPHPEKRILSGRRSERWAAHAKDVDQLHGEERVWVLFTFNAHTSPAGLTVRDELDRRGTLLDSFVSEGSALYLYDLSDSE